MARGTTKALNPHNVKVGSQWRSCRPEGIAMPVVTVTAINGHHAIVTAEYTNLRGRKFQQTRRIRLDAFRKHSRGWEPAAPVLTREPVTKPERVIPITRAETTPALSQPLTQVAEKLGEQIGQRVATSAVNAAINNIDPNTPQA